MDRAYVKKNILLETDNFQLRGKIIGEYRFEFFVQTDTLEGLQVFLLDSQKAKVFLSDLQKMKKKKTGSATILDTEKDAYIIFIMEEDCLRISGRFTMDRYENYYIFNHIIHSNSVTPIEEIIKKSLKEY